MKKNFLAVTGICLLMLTGCAEISENAMRPMMGLEWFAGYDEVKNNFSSYSLIAEREKEENQQIQKMQDYIGISLFEVECDLTLCFNQNGLIGFNYHDIEHYQNYHEWLDKIELVYGIPTEMGTGMASWYDNPLGKDTVIYLFNLEEGVQVSVYATVDSPDKSYEKQKEPYIPVPEIRTPIVPVVNETTIPKVSETETQAHQETAFSSTAVSQTVTMTVQNEEFQENPEHDDAEISEVLQEQPETSVTASADGSRTETTTTTATSTAKASSVSSTSTATVMTTSAPPEQMQTTTADKKEDFRLNGLKFYGSADSEKRKMSAYTQLYEYRTEEPGQPWQLIAEYQNVPYHGKNCSAVLCFTSLGLVGVNYFDSDTESYEEWSAYLTELYGIPDKIQDDCTAWTEKPVGDGTMVYLFALDDGVQISFFADDTGSELA